MPMTTADYLDPMPTVDREPETSEPTNQLTWISEPGCYVCTRTGQLLRVPTNVTPSWFAALGNVDDGLEGYTKISDNPFIPLTPARLIAANLDIETRIQALHVDQ